MSPRHKVTTNRAWKPWLHFNLWSFLLLVLTANLIGWTSDADTYRDRSEVLVIDIVPGTFLIREERFLPHVFISEFQGTVASGEPKSFAIFFYPSKPHRRPTTRHERIFALINIDELKALGADADHPIPVLKYGISPEMENFDYGTGDVNRSVLHDAYKNNVESYLMYNKKYLGVSIATLERVLYVWISLPWGIGCGIYVAVSRAALLRRSQRARKDHQHKQLPD